MSFTESGIVLLPGRSTYHRTTFESSAAGKYAAWQRIVFLRSERLCARLLPQNNAADADIPFYLRKIAKSRHQPHTIGKHFLSEGIPNFPQYCIHTFSVMRQTPPFQAVKNSSLY